VLGPLVLDAVVERETSVMELLERVVLVAFYSPLSEAKFHFT